MTLYSQIWILSYKNRSYLYINYILGTKDRMLMREKKLDKIDNVKWKFSINISAIWIDN